MSRRAIALLGSGEFEPWTTEVDTWLLERANGDGRVLVCPTASAQEGDEVFDRWAGEGLQHFADAGVPAAVLPLRIRSDAERPDLVEEVRRASVVYFSGGNPWYLAETLRDSSLYRAIVGRLDDGLGYAGCSAGVACLTDRTYDAATDDFDEVFKPGLGLVRPGVLFAPHWDVADSWIPGARDAIVASMPPGGVLIGLDEATALLGDGAEWSVVGRQGVHVLRGGAWTHLDAGTRLDLQLWP